jgi:hypothetical protein
VTFVDEKRQIAKGLSVNLKIFYSINIDLIHGIPTVFMCWSLAPTAGASRGNVVLFCGLRNHAGLRGLLGGGRSPAKPVSGGRFPANREKNRDSCLKMGFAFDSALDSVFMTMGCRKIP